MVLGMRTHGIMFHHFHDDKKHLRQQGSISASTLHALLDYYGERYHILKAEEYFEKYKKGTIGEKDVCITFDDGLLCQYDVAYKVLKERELTGFWFVYTSPLVGIVEKIEIYRHFRCTYFGNIDEFYDIFFECCREYLERKGIDYRKLKNEFNADEYLRANTFYSYNDKWFRYLRDIVLKPQNYTMLMDEMLTRYQYDVDKNKDSLWLNQKCIKQLYDNGHVIGLHSHSHPTKLDDMSYEQQSKEFQTNYDILSEIIKPDMIKTVSYPCNSYDENTLKIMRELNVEMGFRANMLTGYTSYLEIPRVNHTNVLKAMQGKM